MRRVLSTAALVAVPAVVAVSAAFTASAADSSSATKVHIALKETGNGHPSAGLVFLGRFRLEVNGTVVDSGTTSIHPNAGNTKLIAGQKQLPVTGSDELIGKKGTVDLFFRGVSIPVNSNASGDAYYAEYGTWTITRGTGMYKGWRGGGRWANAGTPSRNNIEWDGYASY
jgi:hypothetical protein